jgi:hypothetical protein
VNRFRELRGGARSMGKVQVAVAVTMIVTIAGCTRSPSNAEPGRDADVASPATATVKRQDLTMRTEFTGQLGFGEAIQLVASRDGVVTWMPKEGTLIKRGEIMAEIDGSPIRLLYGNRPAWRRLAIGEPNGHDIRQLNDNLAALGYAERSALSGDRFDWRTQEAVYRWQADLGLKPTGSVELGDVVFAASKVRIGAREVQLGAWVGAGQALAHATATEQVVTVNIDPVRRRDLAKGSSVTVIMPDAKAASGIVRSVGRVVSSPAEAGEDASVEVVIESAKAASGDGPRRFGAARGFEAGPVQVRFDRVLARDALVVPVGALMALAGGDFAVERVTGTGTELVSVKPGRFAEGMVEITGAVGEGDEVVVPS